MSKGLSQFFICAVLVRYAVKWCDKLRFCIYYSITTNTNIKINHSELWNCRGPLTSGGPRPRQWKQQPPHRYAAELDRAARVLIYCLPYGVPIIFVRQSQLKCIAILQQHLAALLLLSQESPAIADKPARRESLPKIAPIRRAYNVVADNTGLSSCV